MPTVLRFKCTEPLFPPLDTGVWAWVSIEPMEAWRVGYELSNTFLKMPPSFGMQRIYYHNQPWQVVRIGNEWMATPITNEDNV